jgi:hypothetical protein
MMAFANLNTFFGVVWGVAGVFWLIAGILSVRTARMQWAAAKKQEAEMKELATDAITHLQAMKKRFEDLPTHRQHTRPTVESRKLN